MHVDGRRAHIFKCAKPGCKKTVTRYLDTKDAKSTGNLRKHAKVCWGVDAVTAADRCANAQSARPHLEEMGQTGKMLMYFERAKAEGRVTYSTIQHTRTETRSVIST